jgi:hypothetical protein
VAVAAAVGVAAVAGVGGGPLGEGFEGSEGVVSDVICIHGGFKHVPASSGDGVWAVEDCALVGAAHGSSGVHC